MSAPPTDRQNSGVMDAFFSKLPSPPPVQLDDLMNEFDNQPDSTNCIVSKYNVEFGDENQFLDSLMDSTSPASTTITDTASVRSGPVVKKLALDRSGPVVKKLALDDTKRRELLNFLRTGKVEAFPADEQPIRVTVLEPAKLKKKPRKSANPFSKQAVYAREYRQNKAYTDEGVPPRPSTAPPSGIEQKDKKRLYMREKRQKDKKEVDGLRTRVTDLEETVADMSQEIAYLRSILANESQLAPLLKGMANTPGVKFQFPLSGGVVDPPTNETRAGNKRKLVAKPVSESSVAKRIRCEINPMNKAGVCLHVRQDGVSVELCSRCESQAKIKVVSIEFNYVS